MVAIKELFEWKIRMIEGGKHCWRRSATSLWEWSDVTSLGFNLTRGGGGGKGGGGDQMN